MSECPCCKATLPIRYDPVTVIPDIGQKELDVTYPIDWFQCEICGARFFYMPAED